MFFFLSQESARTRCIKTDSIGIIISRDSTLVRISNDPVLDSCSKVLLGDSVRMQPRQTAFGGRTHWRRTASTQAARSGSRRPAGRAATARCRWPTGTDGSESGTARGTLCAPDAASRSPRSGRSRPGAPSSRPPACRVCVRKKKNHFTTGRSRPCT